jgi:hypothetical protein
MSSARRGGVYQFAAMIGLPNGLTFFDFGFILTFGIEDLFFFFCSSRPMIAVSECGELSLYETTKNLSF